MVELDGVEPPSSVCKAGALPFELQPRVMVGSHGIEPPCRWQPYYRRPGAQPHASLPVIDRQSSYARLRRTALSCRLVVSRRVELRTPRVSDEAGLPDLATGYLYLPAFAGLAVGSLAGSPLGIRLSHRITDIFQYRMFLAYLTLILVVMLLTEL